MSSAEQTIELTTSGLKLNDKKILTEDSISNLVTKTSYANGTAGVVSIKSDSSDGLEVSNVDGNLSIYGALDTDIKNRNSKRPITTINLNKAVLAALTDNSKISPTDD